MDKAEDDSRFHQHSAALTRWATTQTPIWLRAKLDPADLVQQTIMEGLSRVKVLESKSDHEVLAYLRRALANNLIDAVRKFGRGRNDISPDVLADSTRRMNQWLEAPDTSPSERFDRSERFSRLADGLAKLPVAQRIAVEMRYLQGARVSEIASALSRTEGAVAALLHRAVIALRQELIDLEP